MTSKITYDQYVFRFGKYNKMKATDVAKIYTVDKDGKDVATGLFYLQCLVDKATWFRDTDIIKQVIMNAKKNNTDVIEEIPKVEKEKPKKSSTVKINTENKVVEFQ